MRTHIDWLTFTVTPDFSAAEGGTLHDAVWWGLLDLFGQILAFAAFGGAWEPREKSRAPYNFAWAIVNIAATVFASPNLIHATVEISGQGCEELIDLGLLNEVLTKCAERLTRIDIACDMETTVKPDEFVAQTSHERMRASGYQKSDTGETCYVGSQKSDRYARVYRYAPPHPRSNLLRVEHVFRREAAKTVGKACLGDKTNEVAAASGEVFGWRHPCWQPGLAQSADISVVQSERKMGGTVFWLIKQCAPAFKRMVAEGTIRDPEAFLRSYFLPE